MRVSAVALDDGIAMATAAMKRIITATVSVRRKRKVR
jgi:hypothetical protein